MLLILWSVLFLFYESKQETQIELWTGFAAFDPIRPHFFLQKQVKGKRHNFKCITENVHSLKHLSK